MPLEACLVFGDQATVPRALLSARSASRPVYADDRLHSRPADSGALPLRHRVDNGRLVPACPVRPISIVRLPSSARSLSSSRRLASRDRLGDVALVPSRPISGDAGAIGSSPKGSSLVGRAGRSKQSSASCVSGLNGQSPVAPGLLLVPLRASPLEFLLPQLRGHLSKRYRAVWCRHELKLYGATDRGSHVVAAHRSSCCCLDRRRERAIAACPCQGR